MVGWDGFKSRAGVCRSRAPLSAEAEGDVAAAVFCSVNATNVRGRGRGGGCCGGGG